MVIHSKSAAKLQFFFQLKKFFWRIAFFFVSLQNINFKIISIMKKVFMLLLASAFLFTTTSCDKDPKFTIAHEKLEFDHKGGFGVLTLRNTPAEWSVTLPIPEWIKLSETSGPKTTLRTVRIDVDSNTTFAERTTTLVFTSGSESVSVPVKVAGRPVVAVPNIAGNWILEFFDGDSIYPELRITPGSPEARVDEIITRHASDSNLFYVCHFLTTLSLPSQKLVIRFDGTKNFIFEERALNDLGGEKMWQVPYAVTLSGDTLIRLPNGFVLEHKAGILDGDYTFKVTVGGKTFDVFPVFASFIGANRETAEIFDLIENPYFIAKSAPASPQRKAKRKSNKVYTASPEDVILMKDLNFRRR